jgi:hypothetical protein
MIGAIIMNLCTPTLPPDAVKLRERQPAGMSWFIDAPHRRHDAVVDEEGEALAARVPEGSHHTRVVEDL